MVFFKKSISERKGRVAIASFAVVLAVTAITGLLGITVGIREKLGTELRAYGANIVVYTEAGAYLTEDFGARISAMSNVEEATSQLMANVVFENMSFESVGLDFQQIKGRGWRLSGNWPKEQGEILVGINLKSALKLEAGKRIKLVGQGNSGPGKEFLVAGFVEMGGNEDNAFILSLPDLWSITGLAPKVSAVLVRGMPGALDAVVANIKRDFKDVSVKTMRQVAVAEDLLLQKIQLLLALITIVVLFSASVSVASTMGATVLERRKEIGLMKAIGATKKEIGLFYKVEAVFIGLCGGIGGFIIGFAVIQAVSKGAFNSFVNIPFYIFGAAVSIGVAVSVFSSLIPVRGALKYNSAAILRGD
ncbi:MAG: FtsX-like permease family protein [Nitrospirae bacterium]|nr:MAG: FtsX-like permease family protein [Nitrospirota bacterium]